MSWITDRDAKTQANYRYIDFEGARILQTRELEDFEATEALRDKWNNMALFREGALVNVKGTYAGLTVTLSKVDAASATPMLVLVNGSFEAIPAAAASIPVAQAKVSATDPIYLHWVLWKVTYDGANGTIADNTLVDASTNEPVGARGQLSRNSRDSRLTPGIDARCRTQPHARGGDHCRSNAIIRGHLRSLGAILHLT